MANAQRGESAFGVDGRTYVLVFDANALCEIEETLGLSTKAALRLLAGKDPPTHVLRAFLWGGLKRHQPEVTLEDVGLMLDHMAKEPIGLSRALERALERSFPKAKKDGDPGPRVGAATGTGRRSLGLGSLWEWITRRSGDRRHV